MLKDKIFTRKGGRKNGEKYCRKTLENKKESSFDLDSSKEMKIFQESKPTEPNIMSGISITLAGICVNEALAESSNSLTSVKL